MDYLEYTFNNEDCGEFQEILIALLSAEGYEGFNETESELKVYLPLEKKNEERLNEILFSLSAFQLPYTVQVIEDQNWNAKWEQDFKAIEIAREIRVRASFHQADPSFKFEIIIDPKMAFGTGHHETTRLVMQAMLKEEFSGKEVLDMGCGTGILSILASMMKAKSVCAIDIDEWAYENCQENVKLNNCENIQVKLGTIEKAGNSNFDLILANINRNVLLTDRDAYYNLLNPGGKLILSGIMNDDEEMIVKAYQSSGFTVLNMLRDTQWMAVILSK